MLLTLVALGESDPEDAPLDPRAEAEAEVGEGEQAGEPLRSAQLELPAVLPSADRPFHPLDPADIRCPIDTQRKTDKAPGEYSLTFCALPDGRKKGPELLVYSGQGQRMYTEYLLDQEHGEHVITEADGRVMVRGRYELGRKAGLWETWYVGGGRASKGIYRADKKIDIWEEWSQDGTPKRCDYRDPAVPNMQCIEPVD